MNGSWKNKRPLNGRYSRELISSNGFRLGILILNIMQDIGDRANKLMEPGPWKDGTQHKSSSHFSPEREEGDIYTVIVTNTYT